MIQVSIFNRTESIQKSIRCKTPTQYPYQLIIALDELLYQAESIGILQI